MLDQLNYVWLKVTATIKEKVIISYIPIAKILLQSLEKEKVFQMESAYWALETLGTLPKVEYNEVDLMNLEERNKVKEQIKVLLDRWKLELESLTLRTNTIQKDLAIL